MTRFRDTLPARFFANARCAGDGPAHFYLIGGELYPVGWPTMARVVRDLAAGLVALGHEHGDRVAILSETRREWLYWDLACLSVGGVTVGVPCELTDEELSALLQHSGARFCVVESAPSLARVQRQNLPGLQALIVIDADGVKGDGATVLSHAQLRRHTSDAAREVVDDRLRGLTAQDAASFVYADGRQDSPRASMFSHGAVVAAIDSLSPLQLAPTDAGFSHMRLSNSAQRILDYAFLCGATPWCYSAMGSLTDASLYPPSVVLVDSAVLEQAYAAVHDYAQKLPVPGARLLWWARQTGRATAQHKQSGEPIPRPLSLQVEMMRRMLYQRVRGPWGQGVRVVVCHGEPPSPEIVEFFLAAGVPLATAWGPEESLWCATLDTDAAAEAGCVGRAAQGVHIAVDETGEILLSGEMLFSGYFHHVGHTTAAFDASGAFRTGVLGRIDQDARLVVDGARHDMIVTTAGVSVSPGPIERLLTAEPGIQQAIVVGHGRAFLAVLVSVSSALRDTTPEPQLHGLVESFVAACNLELPRASQLTTMRLLPYELSVASGELTPSQQLRREVVREKFAYLIDEIYGHIAR